MAEEACSEAAKLGAADAADTGPGKAEITVTVVRMCTILMQHT